MDTQELRWVRASNLDRAIGMYLDGNKSACARLLDPDDPKPQQINDLINGKKRSFGEKIARRLEEAIGLERFQLDIQDSPLVLLPGRRPPAPIKSSELLSGLSQGDIEKVVDLVAALRKKKRKAG